MDPFAEHDDAVLNDALSSAGLHTLSPPQAATDTSLNVALSSSGTQSLTSLDSNVSSRVTLDTRVEAGGANFSLGQRYAVTTWESDTS